MLYYLSGVIITLVLGLCFTQKITKSDFYWDRLEEPQIYFLSAFSFTGLLILLIYILIFTYEFLKFNKGKKC